MSLGQVDLGQVLIASAHRCQLQVLSKCNELINYQMQTIDMSQADTRDDPTVAPSVTMLQ